MALSRLDSKIQMDELTESIFSILENKFLFEHHDFINNTQLKSIKPITGKVRILSIDGGGSTNGLLAAKSLCQLELSLQLKSGNPNAHISDYFDVAAGSGAGGVLASILFTKSKSGHPLFTTNQALNYMEKLSKSSQPFFKSFFSKKSKNPFSKTFGEISLKETLKSVLIPCFDVTTGAPFLFSRVDAVENDKFDFKIKDVCAATMALGPVGITSIDGTTKISAVGGCLAMNNPTAAAITHVLNNKQEFPFCNSVEDLFVVSLANGESNTVNRKMSSLVKIAGDGLSDMVDQAVSIACRTNNYIRIQGNVTDGECKNKNTLSMANEMLGQRNIESILFQGKRLASTTNMEKIETCAAHLFKEQERRKTSILPTVLPKHGADSPRSSSLSSTTLSSFSSN